MTNDKDRELIERLALEVAKNISFEHRAPLSDTSIITFATRLLAAYLAERGGEAVAVVDENDEGKWADILPNVNVRVGDKLFLAPQPPIPEGMALVPIEPTEAMIEAGKWQIQALNGLESAYKAMIAAAGVKHARSRQSFRKKSTR